MINRINFAGTPKLSFASSKSAPLKEPELSSQAGEVISQYPQTKLLTNSERARLQAIVNDLMLVRQAQVLSEAQKTTGKQKEMKPEKFGFNRCV